jgi:hypothetical protein
MPRVATRTRQSAQAARVAHRGRTGRDFARLRRVLGLNVHLVALSLYNDAQHLDTRRHWRTRHATPSTWNTRGTATASTALLLRPEQTEKGGQSLPSRVCRPSS